MNANEDIPEAIRVTMHTYERVIRSEEQRRRDLLGEISALQLRQRVIGATQDATWIADRFLAPRTAELNVVERRIHLVREKLLSLRRRWLPDPAGTPVPLFMMDACGVTCLTA